MNMSWSNLKIDPASLDLNFKGAFVLGRSSGIAGTVQTCRHTVTSPSSSSQPVTLAVKRYNLERRLDKSDDENAETTGFTELAKLIQVFVGPV